MDITEQLLSEMSLPAEARWIHTDLIYVNRLFAEWPELTWLNRFLGTNVGTDAVDKTSANVLTLHGQRLVCHEGPFDAKRLHVELWYPSTV